VPVEVPGLVSACAVWSGRLLFVGRVAGEDTGEDKGGNVRTAVVDECGTIEMTPDSIRVTSSGTGSPPFAVLTRVAHVFCAQETGGVWQMVRRQLAEGTVAAGDLVLLRVGGGAAEEWTEVAVTG
jgi:hypothetical protein